MSLGLDHKDRETTGQLYHFGALFEALYIDALIAASSFRFRLHFIGVQTSGLEKCVVYG